MPLRGKMTRILCFIITAAMLWGMPIVSLSEEFGSPEEIQIRQEIADTGAYLIKTVGTPASGSIGGDWSLLGLARAGLKLPEGFTESYYKNVEATLKEKEGNLTRNKYSEYSRLILALTAIGKDPTNAAGYDLTAKLSDLEKVRIQGINGPVYALLALDCRGYSIPQSPSAAKQATRELLVDFILQREVPKGGFSLSGFVADPDVTAAALQALSNYRNKGEVEAVIDRALAFLSSVQTEKGGFTGWTTDGLENTESIVQVILALTSLGIDPAKDSRFLKTDETGNTYNALDALRTFRLKDGSYRHLPGGDADLMATEQALLALVSYERLLAGKDPLFCMEDAAGPSESEGAGYEYKVMLNGRYLAFDQPPVNRNGRILVPMRAIFEALGADVEWDNDLRRVTGTVEDRQVRLIIGDATAYINEIPVLLDVPAVIENGRTLVPVRFISESLDAEVNWDGLTNTAIVKTK